MGKKENKRLLLNLEFILIFLILIKIYVVIFWSKRSPQLTNESTLFRRLFPKNGIEYLEDIDSVNKKLKSWLERGLNKSLKTISSEVINSGEALLKELQEKYSFDKEFVDLAKMEKYKSEFEHLKELFYAEMSRIVMEEKKDKKKISFPERKIKSLFARRQQEEESSEEIQLIRPEDTEDESEFERDQYETIPSSKFKFTSKPEPTPSIRPKLSSSTEEEEMLPLQPPHSLPIDERSEIPKPTPHMKPIEINIVNKIKELLQLLSHLKSLFNNKEYEAPSWKVIENGLQELKILFLELTEDKKNTRQMKQFLEEYFLLKYYFEKEQLFEINMKKCNELLRKEPIKELENQFSNEEIVFYEELLKIEITIAKCSYELENRLKIDGFKRRETTNKIEKIKKIKKGIEKLEQKVEKYIESLEQKIKKIKPEKITEVRMLDEITSFNFLETKSLEKIVNELNEFVFISAEFLSLEEREKSLTQIRKIKIEIEQLFEKVNNEYLKIAFAMKKYLLFKTNTYHNYIINKIKQIEEKNFLEIENINRFQEKLELQTNSLNKLYSQTTFKNFEKIMEKIEKIKILLSTKIQIAKPSENQRYISFIDYINIVNRKLILEEKAIKDLIAIEKLFAVENFTLNTSELLIKEKQFSFKYELKLSSQEKNKLDELINNFLEKFKAFSKYCEKSPLKNEERIFTIFENKIVELISILYNLNEQKILSTKVFLRTIEKIAQVEHILEKELFEEQIDKKLFLIISTKWKNINSAYLAPIVMFVRQKIFIREQSEIPEGTAQLLKYPEIKELELNIEKNIASTDPFYKYERILMDVSIETLKIVERKIQTPTSEKNNYITINSLLGEISFLLSQLHSKRYNQEKYKEIANIEEKAMSLQMTLLELAKTIMFVDKKELTIPVIKYENNKEIDIKCHYLHPFQFPSEIEMLIPECIKIDFITMILHIDYCDLNRNFEHKKEKIKQMLRMIDYVMELARVAFIKITKQNFNPSNEHFTLLEKENICIIIRKKLISLQSEQSIKSEFEEQKFPKFDLFEEVLVPNVEEKVINQELTFIKMWLKRYPNLQEKFNEYENTIDQVLNQKKYLAYNLKIQTIFVLYKKLINKLVITKENSEVHFLRYYLKITYSMLISYGESISLRLTENNFRSVYKQMDEEISVKKEEQPIPTMISSSLEELFFDSSKELISIEKVIENQILEGNYETEECFTIVKQMLIVFEKSPKTTEQTKELFLEIVKLKEDLEEYCEKITYKNKILQRKYNTLSDDEKWNSYKRLKISKIEILSLTEEFKKNIEENLLFELRKIAFSDNLNAIFLHREIFFEFKPFSLTQLSIQEAHYFRPYFKINKHLRLGETIYNDILREVIRIEQKQRFYINKSYEERKEILKYYWSLILELNKCEELIFKGKWELSYLEFRNCYGEIYNLEEKLTKLRENLILYWNQIQRKREHSIELKLPIMQYEINFVKLEFSNLILKSLVENDQSSEWLMLPSLIETEYLLFKLKLQYEIYLEKSNTMNEEEIANNLELIRIGFEECLETLQVTFFKMKEFSQYIFQEHHINKMFSFERILKRTYEFIRRQIKPEKVKYENINFIPFKNKKPDLLLQEIESLKKTPCTTMMLSVSQIAEELFQKMQLALRESRSSYERIKILCSEMAALFKTIFSEAKITAKMKKFISIGFEVLIYASQFVVYELPHSKKYIRWSEIEAEEHQ